MDLDEWQHLHDAGLLCGPSELDRLQALPVCVSFPHPLRSWHQETMKNWWYHYQRNQKLRWASLRLPESPPLTWGAECKMTWTRQPSTQHAHMQKESSTACEKEVAIHSSSGGCVSQVRELCMGMKASIYYSQTLGDPLPQFSPKYLKMWLPAKGKIKLQSRMMMKVAPAESIQMPPSKGYHLLQNPKWRQLMRFFSPPESLVLPIKKNMSQMEVMGFFQRIW